MRLFGQVATAWCAWAASQAATAIMNNTSAWPPRSLWNRPQATRLSDTPCSMISAERNITIMFRRLKKPTMPMPNSSAPTIR